MKVSAKNRKFNKNWIVRVYKNSQIIETWKILDRFEWEAASEAESDINKLFNSGRCDDWTMTAK